MRVVATAGLLLALTFAGCIGGGFSETQSTDAFGNTYDVFETQGDVPEGEATVVGATARDLLTKADSMARSWSEQANLFTVATIELSDAVRDEGAPFAGPHPDAYDHADAIIGDGMAPSWNYLYASAEKVTEGQCEYLFVHVAHNGFAVSYTFDPREADFRGDDRAALWTCDEHAPVHSGVDWTVDSDEAVGPIASVDPRFAAARDGADAVLWGLAIHPASDPEDQASFDTTWLVAVMPDLDAGTEGFLTCFTAASDAEFDTECFDQDGTRTGDLDDGDGAAGTTPDPMQPESGSGTVSFGFVFSGDQMDTFTIANASHPALVVDYTVAENQVSGDFTVEILDVNGTSVDSADHTNGGSGVTGSFTIDSPATGDWTVQVSGESGTPEVEYAWCAQGYDYVNATAIDCASG